MDAPGTPYFIEVSPTIPARLARLQESPPISPGGLGTLPGDHCKAASDMRLPRVAVGLLYRQGYFAQTIDADGNQHVTYAASDFPTLPLEPVVRSDGGEVRVAVEL